jgi:hypothetical protein
MSSHPCPKCKAAPFEPCRTPSRKATDDHVARIDYLPSEEILSTEARYWFMTLPTHLRQLVLTAYEAGWYAGMDAGGWA